MLLLHLIVCLLQQATCLIRCVWQTMGWSWFCTMSARNAPTVAATCKWSSVMQAMFMAMHLATDTSMSWVWKFGFILYSALYASFLDIAAKDDGVLGATAHRHLWKLMPKSEDAEDCSNLRMEKCIWLIPRCLSVHEGEGSSVRTEWIKTQTHLFVVLSCHGDYDLFDVPSKNWYWR